MINYGKASLEEVDFSILVGKTISLAELDGDDVVQIECTDGSEFVLEGQMCQGIGFSTLMREKNQSQVNQYTEDIGSYSDIVRDGRFH